MGLPYTEQELDVAARTVYGEARGEPLEGKIAVAYVIRNRVEHGGYGIGINGVCLKKKQFSCWNENDPNSKRLRDPKPFTNGAFKDCVRAVKAAFIGTVADMTRGSRHYHTVNVSPGWAAGQRPVITIGDHVFYNNIK